MIELFPPYVDSSYQLTANQMIKRADETHDILSNVSFFDTWFLKIMIYFFKICSMIENYITDLVFNSKFEDCNYYSITRSIIIQRMF